MRFFQLVAILLMFIVLPSFMLTKQVQSINSEALANKVVASSTAKPTTTTTKKRTTSATTVKTTTQQQTTATLVSSSHPYASILGQISAKDIDVLERLVYFESRGNYGEAVVEIVLNRVLSPSFPNTVQGVVYQSGQFTPASHLYSWSINEASAFADCKSDVARVLGPNYQQILPAHYLYFNNSKPGSSDYRWLGGSVYY